MTLPQKHDRPLQQINHSDSWLCDYFTQQVLPLERRYIQRLYRQMALLNSYLPSADLNSEQTEELSRWINEQLRALHSNIAIEKEQRQRLYRKIAPAASGESLRRENAAETATNEHNNSLWYLFGAASRQQIKQNVDEYCRNRQRQIAQIDAAIAEITSLSALVQHLQQRLLEEDRTVHFLEGA